MSKPCKLWDKLPVLEEPPIEIINFFVASAGPSVFFRFLLQNLNEKTTHLCLICGQAWISDLEKGGLISKAFVILGTWKKLVLQPHFQPSSSAELASANQLWSGATNHKSREAEHHDVWIPVEDVLKRLLNIM